MHATCIDIPEYIRIPHTNPISVVTIRTSDLYLHIYYADIVYAVQMLYSISPLDKYVNK